MYNLSVAYTAAVLLVPLVFSQHIDEIASHMPSEVEATNTIDREEHDTVDESVPVEVVSQPSTPSHSKIPSFLPSDFVDKLTCQEYGDIVSAGVEDTEASCDVDESLLFERVKEVTNIDFGLDEEDCATREDFPFEVDPVLACHLVARYAERCDCDYAKCRVDRVVKALNDLGQPQCSPIVWSYCNGGAQGDLENACKVAAAEVSDKLGINAPPTAERCSVSCQTSNGVARWLRGEAMRRTVLLLSLLCALPVVDV